MGSLSEANGKNAIAIGNNTYAEGTGSFAIGNDGRSR